MKNLLTTLLLTFGVGLATAQATPAATAKAAKTDVKAKTAKTSVEAKAAKVANTPEVKMKKDGTPDKRYKAAKTLKRTERQTSVTRLTSNLSRSLQRRII
ncbi:hypothetical protein [Epilithonimonas sp. UC225_85]|uniref:hypothetical protein n=1 Tax=Epilithonimonas sp. UC225_85 TaxID=3350167 RepID=UPI0036D40461